MKTRQNIIINWKLTKMVLEKSLCGFGGFDLIATTVFFKWEVLIRVGWRKNKEISEKDQNNFLLVIDLIKNHTGLTDEEPIGCVNLSTMLKMVECNGNMKMKKFHHNPRLCLFATQEIVIGDEPGYDYGDDP